MPDTAQDPRLEKLKDELAQAQTQREIDLLKEKIEILEPRK